jgi:hypothetical protein
MALPQTLFVSLNLIPGSRFSAIEREDFGCLEPEDDVAFDLTYGASIIKAFSLSLSLLGE